MLTYRQLPPSEREAIIARTSKQLLARYAREDQSLTVQVMDAIDATDYFSLRRMQEDEHIPLELIMQGEREVALQAYSNLKAANAADEMVNEERLNLLGYELMNGGKLKPAQDIFFVNMQLYPKSANVYDSYAEACLKLGDKKQALEYYKRTLAMNPQNPNAKSIVAELERELAGPAK